MPRDHSKDNKDASDEPDFEVEWPAGKWRPSREAIHALAGLLDDLDNRRLKGEGPAVEARRGPDDPSPN